MIVKKHHGMLWVCHTPPLVINPTQASKIISPDTISSLYSISEFRDSSNLKILLHCDRLPSLINDFMHKERSSTFREISNPVNSSLDVIRPHVFGSIYTESNNTQVSTVL